ncbi:MAG: hypothetical protein AAFX78_07630 [Cyanobacteria bacterium J06638_20]
MTPLDVVIVAVYLFTLIYVGYRAVGNLEDRAALVLDKKGLNAQIEEQGLEEAIAVKIPLKAVYGFEPVASLALTVANLSDSPIYVDWDRSALTDFKGRSRRVVRVTPSMNLDLSRPQVFSVISPGTALNETIVAEDMLKVGEDSRLQVVKPMVDLGPVSSLPEDKTLEFALRLVLQRVAPNTSGYYEENWLTHPLTFRFEARRIPWDSLYPWKQKR